MRNPFVIDCTGCGKKIWLWYKGEDGNMTLCMDCFKKKVNGKRARWLVSWKGFKK